MSPIFMDTSAIHALLVATDRFRARARDGFAGLRPRDARLMRLAGADAAFTFDAHFAEEGFDPVGG